METRNVNSLNRLSAAAWFNAAKNNDIVELRNQILLDDELLDKRNEEGNTALILAIQAGHTNVVEFLLILGADLEHIKNNQQQTAYQIFTSNIAYLTEKKFKEIANLIQEHQGKPNGQTTVSINSIKSYIKALKVGSCSLTFTQYFDINHLPSRLFSAEFPFRYKIAGNNINHFLGLSDLIGCEAFANEQASVEELFLMFAAPMKAKKLNLKKLSERDALKILKTPSFLSLRAYLLNQKKFQIDIYRSCPIFHVNLSEVTFQNLDLQGVCLGAAVRELSDVKYTSNLNHTKLQNVDMSNAIATCLLAEESEFHTVVINDCDLSGANFKKTKLAYVKGKKAIFHGTHFELAHIDNCEFEESDGEKCLANGAQIYNVSFAHSNMQFANFSINNTSDDTRGAILQNVDVNSADFSFSTFYKAEIGELLNIAAPKTKFVKAVFIGVVWQHAETKRLMELHHKKAFYSFNQLIDRLKSGKVLKNLNLSYLNLTAEKEKKFPNQSKMQQVKLLYSMLTDSSLEDCELMDVDFEGATLLKVNFNGASLKNINFKKCILGQTNFNNASLRQADFRESIFAEPVTFENSDISEANFRHGKFNNSSDISIQIKNFLSAKNLTGTILPDKCADYLEKNILIKGKDCREYQMLKDLLKKNAGLHLSELFIKKFDIKNCQLIVDTQEKRMSDRDMRHLQMLDQQHKLFWRPSIDEQALSFERIRYVNFVEELIGSAENMTSFIEATKNRKDCQRFIQDELFNYFVSLSTSNQVLSPIDKYKFLSPKKRQQILSYEHDVKHCLSTENYSVYLSSLASNQTLTPASAYLYAEWKGQSVCIWQEIENSLVLQYKTPGLVDQSTIHLLYDKATNCIQISLASNHQFTKTHEVYFLKFDWFMNLSKQACLGDIQAQHTLACIYQVKFKHAVIYLNQNKEMAYKWFRMAASTEDPVAKQSDFYRDSLYRLGQDILLRFFSNPEAVSNRKIDTMKHWLKQSSNANYPYAKHSLLCYYVKQSKLKKLDDEEFKHLVEISDQLKNASFDNNEFNLSVKNALEEAEVVIVRERLRNDF